MWLSRNNKVLDSFSRQKWEVMPVLRDQVNRGLGSPTMSLVSATSTNDVSSYVAKELWIAHDRTRP